MIIRKTNDIEIIKNLDKTIFWDDPRIQLVDLRETQWWLLWDNHKPVGFCGIRDLDYNVWYHVRAGIKRKYWGNGLQRRMLKVRENYAKKRGCKHIITYTMTTNPASSNNLLKSGYRLYIPEYAWVGTSHILYWIKNLV